MATQPQKRPWFRLGSISRPAPPPPPPAPAPAPASAPATPPLIRPAFIRPLAAPTIEPSPSPQPTVSAPSSPQPRISKSVPASPATKLPSPPPIVSQTPQAPQTSTTSVRPSPKASSVVIPSSSLPLFSTTKAVPPSTSSASTRVPSPTYSSRIIKHAAQITPQSPKPNPTAPPPSPLTLPPAQIKSIVDTKEYRFPRIPAEAEEEAEQKNVLIQKTFEKPNHRHNGNSTLISREIHSKEKKKSHSEEMGNKVITIAGENKGAFMELIQSPKKKEVGGNSFSLFNKSSVNTEKKGERSSNSSDNEENSKAENDKSHKGKANHGLPVPMSSAFMNSNIQGVNNSIMFNSSFTHHDTGVHLALLRKPAGGGFHVKDDQTGLHN